MDKEVILKLSNDLFHKLANTFKDEMAKFGEMELLDLIKISMNSIIKLHVFSLEVLVTTKHIDSAQMLILLGQSFDQTMELFEKSSHRNKMN